MLYWCCCSCFRLFLFFFILSIVHIAKSQLLQVTGFGMFAVCQIFADDKTKWKFFFLSNRLIWMSNGNLLMNLLNATNSIHLYSFYSLTIASTIIQMNPIEINENKSLVTNTLLFRPLHSHVFFMFIFIFGFWYRMLQLHSKWTKTLKIYEPNKGSKVSNLFYFLSRLQHEIDDASKKKQSTTNWLHSFEFFSFFFVSMATRFTEMLIVLKFQIEHIVANPRL